MGLVYYRFGLLLVWFTMGLVYFGFGLLRVWITTVLDYYGFGLLWFDYDGFDILWVWFTRALTARFTGSSTSKVWYLYLKCTIVQKHLYFKKALYFLN